MDCRNPDDGTVCSRIGDTAENGQKQHHPLRGPEDRSEIEFWEDLLEAVEKIIFKMADLGEIMR